MPNPYTLTDIELDALLTDDAPWGDATSWGLGISALPGRMQFCARHAQVVCGSEEAARMAVLRMMCDGERIDLTSSGWPAAGSRLYRCILRTTHYLTC